MDTGTAADEVIDMIANIEIQRQVMEKEVGLAASCGLALRRLNGLLDGERQALQLHGPNTGHPANIEALTIAIERVNKLARITNQRSVPKRTRLGPRQVSLRSGTRIPPRNKGRRTMGRAGGR